MPAAPEFRDRLRNVGIVEVLQKIESQHLAKSDRHIGVSGEIKVDLEGIADGADPGGEAALLGNGKRRNALIDLTGAVGKQYLLA